MWWGALRFLMAAATRIRRNHRPLYGTFRCFTLLFKVQGLVSVLPLVLAIIQ